jgi:hypothetical protein
MGKTLKFAARIQAEKFKSPPEAGALVTPLFTPKQGLL